MKLKNILICLLFAKATIFSQSLQYSGASSYDIASSIHEGEFIAQSLEPVPTGMAFGDSGNKFYMVGSGGDHVIQYNLSAPYDFSTRGPIQSFIRVATEEGAPEDVLFNENNGADSGKKMYILGGAGDDVTVYDLSTAWDVSTATPSGTVFDASLAIETFLADPIAAPAADLLTAMTFNDDGSSLYIVNRTPPNVPSGSGRVAIRKVFQFDLTTNYDLSAGVTLVGEMVTTGENNPRGISFNDTGTLLFVTGNAGDNVVSYPLATAYDITTAGGRTETALPTEIDDTPQAIIFNDLGTRFYVAGSDDDVIREYSLTNGFDFASTLAFEGSDPFISVEIDPRGMVFNSDGTKLFIAGNQINAVSELTLSTPYNIGTGTVTAGIHINADEGTISGLAFNDGDVMNPGKELFIIGTENDEINQYSLGIAYDLSSFVPGPSEPTTFSVASHNTEPTDILFNDDGSKIFILGNAGTDNEINQITLAGNYDLTGLDGIVVDVAFTIGTPGGTLAIDNLPMGMAFSTSGDKLYVAGNSGNDITEVTLSNDFDLSMGTIEITNNFSVATEEDLVQDIVFNADGSKFYITGIEGGDMNQYSSKGLLEETITNDGTIDDVTSPYLITLTGDTFVDLGSGVLTDGQVTIANLPLGLTPVFTINSTTEVQLTFTGKADSHINSDEAAANLEFNFTNAAFFGGDASAVTSAVGFTDILGFDFIECGTDIVRVGGSWTGGSNAGVPDVNDAGKSMRIQQNVTITEDVVCDCLNVESGRVLRVANNVTLTVKNALELDGDLRLLGNNAQLLQDHVGTKNVSGNGDLYKRVKGRLVNVYQTSNWSSPVTTNGTTYTIKGVLKDGQSSVGGNYNNTSMHNDITFTTGFDGDFTTDPITLSSRFLYKFIDADNWSSPVDEETELFNPGEGFAKNSTGDPAGQFYVFKGSPNDGEYLHEIGPFNTGRWSMLGNPYPSPISADQFIEDNAITTTSIEGTLYFYQSAVETSHIGSEFTGGYATRTFALGVGSGIASPGDGLNTVPDENIAVGQGFFVEASGTGGTITFDNSQRVLDPTNGNTKFFLRSAAVKKETTSFPILRIGFEFLLEEEKIYHRQVAVGFRGLTNEHENGYDAAMWDYRSTDMALKVANKEDIPYAITGIEDFKESLTIPLQVNINTNRDVTFTIDESNLESKTFLFDSFTETYYDLSLEKATFNLANGTYNDRFFITFSNKVLSVDENEIIDVAISNFENELVIKTGSLSIENVKVYNLLGQTVLYKKNTLNTKEFKASSANIQNGVYIVKVKTDAGIASKKIIIN